MKIAIVWGGGLETAPRNSFCPEVRQNWQSHNSRLSGGESSAPLLASEIKDHFQKALGVKIFQFTAALPLPVSLISALMSSAVAPLMLFIVFVPWALVVLKALLLVCKGGKRISNTFSDISFSLECIPGSLCHTWAAWIYPMLLSVPWFAPANWAILGLFFSYLEL